MKTYFRKTKHKGYSMEKKEKKKIKATIQKNNQQKDQNNISYDWFTLLKTLNWNSIRAQKWMTQVKRRISWKQIWST